LASSRHLSIADRQYTGGRIGDVDIEDFLKTDDISPATTTETYVALKLTIDNWRWAGVPFPLRQAQLGERWQQ
jgi:glucose-6-phosphate 1-dehydrogenase